MRKRSTVASVEKAACALDGHQEPLCGAAASRDHPYLHPLHLNVDQKMRRAIVVHDPLVNRADDIGAAGVQVRTRP